jgi:hypothetical protein
MINQRVKRERHQRPSHKLNHNVPEPKDNNYVLRPVSRGSMDHNRCGRCLGV